MFPILIGLFEATSIDRRIKKEYPQRPLTHDLLKATIEALDGEAQDVLDGMRPPSFGILEAHGGKEGLVFEEVVSLLGVEVAPVDLDEALRELQPLLTKHPVLLRQRLPDRLKARLVGVATVLSDGVDAACAAIELRPRG